MHIMKYIYTHIRTYMYNTAASMYIIMLSHTLFDISTMKCEVAVCTENSSLPDI